MSIWEVEHLIVANVSKEKITLDGHAGYAEPEKDIVCAAVTALVQTMVHRSQYKGEADVIFDIEDGITPFDTDVFVGEYLI